LSFLSFGQSDDGHAGTKHVADLWTKYIVVFLLELFYDLIIYENNGDEFSKNCFKCGRVIH
jgi:hypothetical protein